MGPGLPELPRDYGLLEELLETKGFTDPRWCYPWLCHGCRALWVRDEPWPYERNACPKCGKTTQRIAWAQYRFEKRQGRLGFRQSLSSSSGGPVVCTQCGGRTNKKMLASSGGLCAKCLRYKQAPMRDVQKRIRKVKHALARRDQ